MPKALLDFLGYAVYFWVNEGEPLEPVHVHVAKGKPTANATKFWITSEGVKLEHNNSQIPDSDMKKIVTYLVSNRSTIITNWLDRFGVASYKTKF